MAFTRETYDKCYCKEQVSQSTKPYDHIMNSLAFEHPNTCRINLGFSDGNMVSTVGNSREAGNGNLVDVDSILKGLDKYNTRCNPEQSRVQLNPGKTNDLKECTFVKKPYTNHKPTPNNRC